MIRMMLCWLRYFYSTSQCNYCQIERPQSGINKNEVKPSLGIIDSIAI